MVDDLLHEIAEATKNINDLSKYPGVSGEEIITRLVNPLAEAFGSLPVCRLAPPGKYKTGPLEDALIKDTDAGARVTEDIRAYLAEEDEYDQRAREVYSVFMFYYCKPVPVPTDEEWNAFLSDFPPGKVKKLLPDYTPEPRALEILRYTKDEMKALRRGGPGADQARDARAIRARAFLATLPVKHFIKILETVAPQTTGPDTQGKTEDKKSFKGLLHTVSPEDEGGEIPRGSAHKVEQYAITKDLLTKAIFGEHGEGGKRAYLSTGNPAPMKLYNPPKGKPVCIYTALQFDDNTLKRAGIELSKSLTIKGELVFGAMLSHALAGNMKMSFGMIGEKVFGKPSNKLTEENYIFLLEGAVEVFSTNVYIDTSRQGPGKTTTLKAAKGIEKAGFYDLFPMHIAREIEINGQLVPGVEVYRLPEIYLLQRDISMGQILEQPIEALDTPGKTDEDLAVIRFYLMQRVDILQHSRKTNMQTVLFSSLAEYAGIGAGREERHRREGAREKATRILNDWKNKELIEDYSEIYQEAKSQKRKGAFKGFKLLVNRKQKVI